MGWFRKKSDEAVDSATAAETINKAFVAHGRGEYATALRLLRPLADQGNANAQYNLGNMYMDGQGVPQNDAEAVKWFRCAAEQGFIDAQSNLGVMYIDGRGVRQNYHEALRWLRLAADQSDAEAQTSLGAMYLKGAGVQQSIGEAMKWYRRAADQGLALAQFNVGVGYATGQGVPRDDIRAHMWFNLSAAQGNHDAARNLDTIEQIMTSAQIVEAQKLAREWKPKSHTVKKLLISRAPPWNRVAPIVINTIVAAITDKGLLEAFVMHSMNSGLVARYEALGEDSPTVIGAQISHILCQTGNRAIPTLAKALTGKQMEAAHKAMMLAGDTFEAAIALAKNQIAAYIGLATIYGLVGKAAEAQKYARLGLSELEKMRHDPTSRALRDSTIFPADIIDQMEQQLRRLLANE